MKKILNLIMLILIANINAETYTIKIDKKHYNKNIEVEEYNSGEESTPPEPEYPNTGFTKTDWNNPSDNLITRDNATGLEWLNLQATDGMTTRSVIQQLSSTYNGFRLPTRTEMTTLMQNLGEQNPPSHSTTYLTTLEVSNNLNEYFSITWDGYTTLAWFYSGSGTAVEAVGTTRHPTYTADGTPRLYFYTTHSQWNLDYSHDQLGVWLVR